MIRIKKRFLLLITSILIILIFGAVVFTPFRYLFIKIVQVPIKVTHICLNQIRSLFTLRTLTLDLEKFSDIKKELNLTKADNQELKKENERLRGLLNLQKEQSLKTVAAEVIFADASNWSWGIIINKGSGSGVQKDDAVISPNGLVGKVIEVWPGAAHVLLINDSDFAAAAMLSGSREKGVVVGSLDGSCRMLYINYEAGLAVDEKVITSGIESIFPKGIPIGKVTAISKDYSGEIFLEIKPYINISRTEEVLVVIK